MKVFQVVKAYFDGDHDHGYYESPLFFSRELAQAFLDRLVSAKNSEYPDPNYKKWWGTDTWGEDYDPTIIELEIMDNIGEFLDGDKYLHITYT